jgi:long-chain fatty acid transport protein
MLNRDTVRNKGIIQAVAVITLLIVSQQTIAAGFALKEQSVTYLGNAFSGTASTSEDASTNWYNPAGLTQLKNNQVVAAGTFINGNIKLYNARATFLGVPVTGQNPTYPGTNAIVPGGHASWRYNRCVVFGISVVSPFGLATKYPGNSIARFMATKSKLLTIDLTPGVAIQLHKQWSLGIAADFVRVVGDLNAATNFGAEGYLNNKATGWAYGMHAGVLYTPTDATKMGLAYFSRLTPHLNGGTTSLNFPGPARTSVSGKINLPDRFVYSITHTYDEKWAVMADVEWTHWSVLKQLILDYNTGAQTIENQYYKNTWRFALGANYRLLKCLMFKGGLSYDQSPVQYTYRGARLPDANRYWVACGVKYTRDNISIDAAYAYAIAVDAPIALTATAGRTLFGNYRNSANLVGVQLTWNFV